MSDAGTNGDSLHCHVRADWTEALAAKAEKNIKKWGLQSLETLGLAVAEEAGELAQAILKHRWEGGSLARIAEEADDLGALCLQVRARLAKPGCAACDRGDYMIGHSDDCPNSSIGRCGNE